MSIDFSPYLQPTKFSANQGVTLASRLVSAAPDDLGERERTALGLVRRAESSLKSVLRGRIEPDGERLRPFAVRLTSARIALRDAMDANTRLDGSERVAIAQKLLAKTLPQGTSFVRLSFVEVWPESENHLLRIDELALAPQIDALIGPHFLAHVRAMHVAFSEALGIGRARPANDPLAVRNAKSELAEAIVEYGRMMVAWVDRARPESVEAFRAAMRPLDEHRATLVTRGAIEDVEETDEPIDVPVVPVVPSEPTPAPLVE